MLCFDQTGLCRGTDCTGQFGSSRFSTLECQSGVARRPEDNIMDLAGILSDWDSFCVS